MESPLLQPVPTPKRRIVAGTHKTRESAVAFTVVKAAACGVVAQLGADDPDSQGMHADDLRELAELFVNMANALDGK